MVGGSCVSLVVDAVGKARNDAGCHGITYDSSCHSDNFRRSLEVVKQFYAS